MRLVCASRYGIAPLRGHTELMSTYRPNRVPGQTFFFTVHLAEHRSALLTEHISAFGEAIRQARGKRPFHVDAWVVLPNHAHAIWTLPPGDDDCASRWRSVKIAFSKAVRKTSSAQAAIWERHYRQVAIGNDAHYRDLVDFVHNAPVKHGLCRSAAEWPWSSVHRFVAEGFIIPAPRSDVLPLAPSPPPHENSPWP